MEPYAKGFTHPFFKPINFRDYRNYLPTAYDNSLDMYQQMTQVLQFCNEIGILNQDMSNNWNMLLSWIETNGVDEAVTGLLNQWVVDGTMAKILDKTALKDINKKLDNLSVKEQKDFDEAKAYAKKLFDDTNTSLKAYIDTGLAQLKVQSDNEDKKLANKINAMTGGSPKGVYNSIEELKNAHPNGGEGVFVVKNADGTSQWYYYDNGLKLGGDYLKVTLGANSVTGSNLAPDASFGVIFTGGGAVPNYDTTKKTLSFFHTANVVYRGSEGYKGLVGPDSATLDKPFVIDMSSQDGFLFYDVYKDTFTIRYSSNNENEVIIAGRRGDNFYMTGQYTINYNTSYVNREPNYNLYAFDNSIVWNINKRTFEIQATYNNGKDIIQPTKQTIEYTGVTQFIYFDFVNNIFVLSPPPAKYTEPYVMLGYFSENSQNIFLETSAHIKVIGKTGDNRVTTLQTNNAWLGDSITNGVIGVKGDNKFISRIDKMTDGINDNYGVDSSTIAYAGNNPAISMQNRVSDIDMTKYRNLIVFGGTNDFAQSVEIGTFDDLNTTTVYGALRDIVKKTYSSNKGVFIYFVSPLWRYRFNDNTEIDINTYKNSKGYTLIDYATAIKTVADYYNLPYLDLLKVGINRENQTALLADGLHPNNIGHDLLAGKFVSMLKG